MKRERPSRELLNARRDLEDLPGVELLGDLEWYEYGESARWVLHCRLTPDITPTEYVPAATEWYVAISPEYPLGEIRFYPAKQGSIERTFHHQLYNGLGEEKLPWRAGDICRYSPLHTLGLHGADPEPLDAWKRLSWHFRRALQWLRDAAADRLILAGDPFELPAYPESNGPILVFSEGRDSLPLWSATRERAGYVELFTSKTISNRIFVRRFRSRNGEEVAAPSWGTHISRSAQSDTRGIWILLNSPPVLPPWHPPDTWSALREAVRLQDLALDPLLETVTNHIRDGQRHLALVGFPIPDRVGDVPAHIHWNAIHMPALAKALTKIPKAQRGKVATEKRLRYLDRTNVLWPQLRVEWLESENWHAEQVSRRRGEQ